MAAVTNNYDVLTPYPGIEVVNVTAAADGDTYTARTLTSVRAVCITFQGTPDATDAFGYTISGATVTLVLVGTNAPTGTYTLVLFGDA